MSDAPYLLPGAPFGAAWVDVKGSTRWSTTVSPTPSGKQVFVEATEVADQCEMTRADLDR